MTWTPKVQFKNPDSALRPTDKEISSRLLRGRVSNTALSIHQAKKREGFGVPVPYAGPKVGRQHHPHHHPHRHAIEVSDPSLDRSDETAVAINPKNPRNIVAGAASFNGTQFTNTAYVTKDRGMTWSQPAAFGFGDKTAVAARGDIALCGFDRVNTEACAFTLDGGLNWTVHDFTDRGIGTAPLVSYDHKHFYIIYAALDNNLIIYASHDQGQTWTGPTTIVAGNAPESTIAGPLSYEGGAATR